MPATLDTPIISGTLVDFGGNSRRVRFQNIGKPKANVTITLPSSITIEKRTTANNVQNSFTYDVDYL